MQVTDWLTDWAQDGKLNKAETVACLAPAEYATFSPDAAGCIFDKADASGDAKVGSYAVP